MVSQANEQFLLLVLMSELLTDNDLLTSLLLRECFRDCDVVRTLQSAKAWREESLRL